MGEERYGVALFLLMAACIFIMAAPDGAWGKVVIVTLEGGALVASSRAAQVSMHDIRTMETELQQQRQLTAERQQTQQRDRDG